ncbi:CheY-like superfamily [Haematococcus lacustris]
MRNLPTTYTSSGTQQHQSSVIGITQHRSVSIELERPPGPILIVDDLPLNRVVLSMMVKKAGLPVAFACNGLECVKAIQSQPPGSYCMILMDLHMPCMDGFTATQMLRRWETSLQPQHLQPQTLEPLSNQPHQQQQQEEDPPPPLCETQQPPNQTAASVHPRRRLPIVACTAELYGSPPLNEGHLPGGVVPGSTAASHALRCGADECVAKPLPFATLCSILRRYVPAWSLPPALAMPRVPASLPSAAPAQEPWLMQPMQLSSLSQQSDAEQVAKWGAELAARAGAPGHASPPVSQCLAAGSTEPGRQAGISQNVEDPLAAASCAVQARPAGAEVACHGGAEDGPGSPCASVSLHAMC